MLEDPEITRILDLITKAFDGVERADGITLHEARAIDIGTDREAARARDTELRWQDIPSEHIEHLTDVLGYMDALGFRYYVPAYMCWSLRNWRTTQWNTPWVTVAFLTDLNDPKQRNDNNHIRVAFEILNQEQQSAVREFLRYMK